MIKKMEHQAVTVEIAGSTAHLEEILALQKKNHFSAFSTREQEENGFVFAAHNLPLLQLMAARLPQVVALSEGKVVGYSLAMTADMQHEIPSLAPMFEEFKKWTFEGKPLLDYKFVVGGQVCVDERFRGRGLIRELYHKTKEAVGATYELCITEISVRNNKSLKAHQKLGFQIIGTYHDGAETWNLVVWKYT